MKSMFKLFGIIALVAVIGFVAACSNGSTGGGGGQQPSGPTSTTFVSYDDERTRYELVITKAATSRSAYDPQNGDTYKLTITFVNGTVKISTGTVTVTIDPETSTIKSIELKHTSTGTTVTVTVSSTGEDTNFITSFSIEIPVDSGEPVQPPDLSYTPNETNTGYILINGTSIVTKGNGVAVIPDTFNGKPVTAIGPMAFFDNKNLTSVTIPASVTDLADWGDGGWWAGTFSDCTNLTTVTFATNSQLKTIGGGAFASCTSLTSITIPASVTYIGDYAFQGCESLTAITIPAGVTSLGSIDEWSGVFQDCKKLETVTFAPNSRLKTIGIGAFAFSGLKNITIPASVTSIGSIDKWAGTFDGCTNLTAVNFAPNSQLKIIGDGAFTASGLTSITIPSGVTSIGDFVFSDCTSLSAITIPNSVTSIGSYTFGGSSLTSITIPNSVISIGAGAFQDCTSLSAITIPNSVKSIGVAFWNWTSSQTINVQGHASEEAAAAAWGWDWLDTDAVRKYWNGSSYQ